MTPTIPCPACAGDGRIPDKTGGGHHGRCPECLGTGVEILIRVPLDLVESANVIGYHRVRPGRRVCAHAQVNGKPVVFIGHGLGTKRERWEYAATAFEGFLEAVAPGMVRNKGVGMALPRETVSEFRKRCGYEAVAS